MRVLLVALLSRLCCARVPLQVSHSYSSRNSRIAYDFKPPKRYSFLEGQQGRLSLQEDAVKILHITDSHVSLFDDDPPHTHRMFNAMRTVQDKDDHKPKHPSDQLVALFQLARRENVDLIALGGDIVNYPSEREVSWVLQKLKEAAPGIPFIYTAGNHDWHMEFMQEPRYDSSRLPQLSSTLKPFFEQAAGTSSKGLYGMYRTKGIKVLFFDNSNHQINEEQLAFAKKQFVDKKGPLLLLLHIPLAFQGIDLPPKELCGHPAWGSSTDVLAKEEGRPVWPPTNEPSTSEFIKLVQQHSAPNGPIMALLTGHVHRDFTTDLPGYAAENVTGLSCVSTQLCAMGSALQRHMDLLSGSETASLATGAVQYSTLDAAEGGYRLVQVQRQF